MYTPYQPSVTDLEILANRKHLKPLDELRKEITEENIDWVIRKIYTLSEHTTLKEHKELECRLILIGNPITKLVLNDIKNEKDLERLETLFPWLEHLGKESAFVNLVIQTGLSHPKVCEALGIKNCILELVREVEKCIPDIDNKVLWSNDTKIAHRLLKENKDIVHFPHNKPFVPYNVPAHLAEDFQIVIEYLKLFSSHRLTSVGIRCGVIHADGFIMYSINDLLFMVI